MTQDPNFGALPNQTRTSYRNAVNNCFQAVATQHAGASEPAITYANMFWFDTSSNLVKLRDASNTSWIEVGVINPFAWNIENVQERSGVLNSAVMSGTEVIITSIPEDVFALDVTLNAISMSSLTTLYCRLGTSAGIFTSPYASQCEEIGASPGAVNGNAFKLGDNLIGSIVGSLRFTNINNNWNMMGILGDLSTGVYNNMCYGGGIAPDVIDRISLIVGGVSFTGGSFSVRWYK